MQYARAKWEMHQKTLAYRVYMTDSIRLIPQNQYVSMRWVDMVRKSKPQDKRSAEEIAMSVIINAGLKMEQ